MNSDLLIKHIKQYIHEEIDDVRADLRIISPMNDAIGYEYFFSKNETLTKLEMKIKEWENA